MWTAHLFQVTTGQIGPAVDFESVSWNVDLNDIESINIKLRKSGLPVGINYTYWLSPWWAGIALFYDGTPIVAGPILTRPNETFDSITVACGGIRSILAKRLVAKEFSDWSLLNKSSITFANMSLGTIAKRVVQHATDKYGGALPITYAVPDEIFPVGQPHERTYRGFNVQNINADDILTKLSEVTNGPDIMFKPKLLGDNILTFEMWHGTENQPRIYQSQTHVWDTTPERGKVVDLNNIVTGSYQTNRTYSLGAGTDEGIIIKVNTNTTPMLEQYPLLETVVNIGNSEDPDVVNSYGTANLKENTYPLLEIQMTVRADGTSPIGSFWPGDMVEIITQGWFSLPDGVTRMRILSMTGDSSNNVRVSLQKDDKLTPLK